MDDIKRIVDARSSRESDDPDDSSSMTTSHPRDEALNSDSPGEPSSLSPSNVEIVLKPSTSSWKREDLLALKICVSCNNRITPMDIVNMIDIHHIGRTSLSVGDNQIDKLVTKLERRVKYIANEIRNTAAHQVMTKPIDDMDDKDALFHIYNVWNMRPPQHESEEDFFKLSFQVYGKDFSRYLRDCIYLRDKQGKDLSEYVYQHLFVYFLQMFGLKCGFAPLIPTTHVRILGQKVSAVPDIVCKFNFYDEKKELKQKSLFVSKVKKHYEGGEEPAPKKARFSPPGPAVSDALLGQHGGELLLNYPSSIAKNASIGLIVEKTHVTFTALLIAEEDFSKLKDGSLKLKKTVGPKLIFTRRYNFMLKEDRDSLIEPLLKLGFIQDIGCN